MRLKIGNTTFDTAFDSIDIDVIQTRTPVVTGNLRDSFTIDIDGFIVNTADYADEVELGTTNRAGRFMVTQSIPEIQQRLEQRITTELNAKQIITLPVIKMRIG